jgi:ATP-dependent DNA helicase UvrD/PcrA
VPASLQPVRGAILLEHMFDGDPGLNAQQRAAAAHPCGALLIVAGAGTGKTMTLAARVAHLLAEGVAPPRILLLTFSRRAAREMLSRAQQLTGSAGAGEVWGGTFHAVGNRLLRLYGRPLGVRPDFTVLDQADAADVMNLLRDEIGLAASERRFPRKETLAAIYSRTVNAGSKLSRILETDYPWCAKEIDGIRQIFAAYTSRKREQNVLDYDDLLLSWKALAAAPETGAKLAGLFEHILVDEYQDTNVLQSDILRAMRPPGTDVTVVGDDAQSIYGFRSATVRNILDFPRHFPGATIVRLEQNYRSTPPLLAASNAVIARSPQRHDKTLWSEREGRRRPELRTCLDEAEQCNVVCDAVLEHREQGVPLHRQAVLFRTGHHSDLLEVELARRNIPFVKYGGLKFLEAAHVKDVLALLRILENPRDEVSWFRVLLLLDGVGPATARRLVSELGVRRRDPDASLQATGLSAAEPVSERSPIRTLIESPPAVPRGARRGLEQLRSAMRDCDDEAGLPPAGQIERLRRFCEPVFVRRYDAPEARLADVDQLEQLAGGYPTRGRFIAELTLDPPSSTGDLAGPPLLDEDWLVLSTMHSAKGLEWDVVHVIHAADGMIPSDMSTGDDDQIEEERRLLYVALTRARDMLHVTFPQRYYRRPRGLEDPHAYAQLSRFLPEEVLVHFDRVAPAVAAEPEPVGAGGGRIASVDSYLTDLWR